MCLCVVLPWPPFIHQAVFILHSWSSGPIRQFLLVQVSYRGEMLHCLISYMFSRFILELLLGMSAVSICVVVCVRISLLFCRRYVCHIFCIHSSMSPWMSPHFGCSYQCSCQGKWAKDRDFLLSVFLGIYSRDHCWIIPFLIFGGRSHYAIFPKGCSIFSSYLQHKSSNILSNTCLLILSLSCHSYR